MHTETSKPLTPEQAETFLSLWERVIEQCDERLREDMERERGTLWVRLLPGEKTRTRARALLSSLSRSVSTDDEEGLGDELLLQMAEFRRALA